MSAPPRFVHVFARAAYTFLIILLVSVAIYVWFFSVGTTTPIPDSALNPPLYPGAQNVTKGEATPNPRASNVYQTKQISYQVEAKPDDVLAFYETQFAKDRWEEPLFVNDLFAGKVFEWHQAGINGPTDTAFRTMVTTDAIDEKRTRVILEIVRFDPR